MDNKCVERRQHVEGRIEMSKRTGIWRHSYFLWRNWLEASPELDNASGRITASFGLAAIAVIALFFGYVAVTFEYYGWTEDVVGFLRWWGVMFIVASLLFGVFFCDSIASLNVRFGWSEQINCFWVDNNPQELWREWRRRRQTAIKTGG